MNQSAFDEELESLLISNITFSPCGIQMAFAPLSKLDVAGVFYRSKYIMKTTQLDIVKDSEGNIILFQNIGDNAQAVEITTDMVDLVIKGLLEVRAEITLNVK